MTEYFTKFNNINLILLYLFSVKMWQVIASEPSPPSELSLTNPNTDLHTHLSSLVLTWHAPIAHGLPILGYRIERRLKPREKRGKMKRAPKVITFSTHTNFLRFIL